MYTDIKYKFIRHVEALMIYTFFCEPQVCVLLRKLFYLFEMSLNLFLGILRGYLKDIIHIFFIVLNLLILNLSSQLLLLYFVYYIFFPFPAFWKVTVLSSEIISS